MSHPESLRAAEQEEALAGNSTLRKRRVTAACETCRRRKEGCDGKLPCARCIERDVEIECYFVSRQPKPHKRRRGSQRQPESSTRLQLPAIPPTSPTARGSSPCSSLQDIDVVHGHVPAIITPEPAQRKSQEAQDQRLIPDQNGRLLFIGDTANLSFLQTLRSTMEQCVGPCPLVDDPLCRQMVEDSPEGQPEWLTANPQSSLPDEVKRQAETLLDRYCMATDCLLDLFDESELRSNLNSFCEGNDAAYSIPPPVYCLILAIGAQADQQDSDNLATSLFARGRNLTVMGYMEDASLSAVQCHALITFYLIGASRLNAAFMYLGIAVRAAYAIGLHRREIALSFNDRDFETRERTWRCLRILDLVMSASLGRPPSTVETRETELGAGYCPSIDLCHIGEKVLTQVCHSRTVSVDKVNAIAAHHRRWAARFSQGPARCKIPTCHKSQDKDLPDLGRLHVKVAYYWTVVVLTAPLFIKTIQYQLDQGAGGEDPSSMSQDSFGGCDPTFTDACFDSAIRLLDLCEELKGCPSAPKRLPLVTTCVFISAVIIGFASVSDKWPDYLLDRYMCLAQELLIQFRLDRIAERDAKIVGFLRDASRKFNERRFERQMHHRRRGVEKMFGGIHSPSSSDLCNREHASGGLSSSAEGSDPSGGAHLGVKPTVTVEALQDDVVVDGLYDSWEAFGSWEAFADSSFTPLASSLDPYGVTAPLLSTTTIASSGHA